MSFDNLSEENIDLDEVEALDEGKTASEEVNKIDVEKDSKENDELEDAEEKKDEVEEEEEEEEIQITLDDEPIEKEEKEAPGWVKELRKTNRKLKRKNKELESLLNRDKQDNDINLEPKPTLESFEYDTAKFEYELEKWYAKKVKFDEVQNNKKRELEAQKQDWENKLSSYNTNKAELNLPDYEEAETNVENVLSVSQQGIIVQGAENPALLVYALGKSSKKLKELSEIKDPIKYAVAIAKLETKLKMTKSKKSKPTPEKILSSGASTSGIVGKELDRLRKEAEKTGDYTKVSAYKKKIRNKK